MTYRLFIDDERSPPRGGENDWVIARSSAEAKQVVRDRGVPSFISYDHDLGGNDTSMNFIWWLIGSYLDGTIQSFPINYGVHSQNPVGARNIQYLLDGFIKCEITGR